MTQPKFTDQISLGNIIQIAVLVVSLSVMGAIGLAQTEANAGAIKGAMGEHGELKSRVRSLEVGRAQSGERLENVSRDIAEIKTGMRETNGLLRQMLRQLMPQGGMP